MAVLDLNAEVAAIASLPKKMRLARWLISVQGSGTAGDYSTLPDQYLWAKIAVAYGCPRTEADYISLPKNYIWSDIYNAISGDTSNHYDWCERQALGWIIAAEYGVTGNSQLVAYYISLSIPIQEALLAGFGFGTTTLSATPNTETSIALNWIYGGNIIPDGFYIERSTDGVNFTQIAQVGNVTTYNATGLAINTLYYFRIRAFTGFAVSDYSNIVSDTPFIPADLNGLAAWYSADFGVLNQIGGATAFSAANSQFLTSNSSSLKKGDTDYTITGWINITSISAGTETFLGAWDFAANQRNYRIARSGSFLLFQVSSNGATLLTAQIIGLTTGWIFFTASHNASANLISLSVNNGTPVSTSVSVGFTSSADFFMGSANGTSEFCNSTLDEITFHDRLLTSDERTFLFNGGFGRTYSEAPDSLKSGLVSWWSMNAPGSGNWIDSHGTNNLTPSASRPTSADGVTLKDATNGQTVRRWLDRSGNGRNLDQSVLANQPIFTSATGGVTFDGSNDFFDILNGTNVFQNKSYGYIFAVVQDTNPTGGFSLHHVVIISTGTNATSARAILLTRQTANVFAEGGRRLDADVFSQNTSANNSNLNILEARFSWAENIQNLIINGVSSANAGFSSGAGLTSNTASLGARVGGDGVNFFPGNIREIIIVNGPLTEAQILQNRRYLTRWGVTI